MDLLNGAKQLADLLATRHGGEMDVRPTATVQAIGALPVFYWLGVEPPAAPANGHEAARPHPPAAASAGDH